LSLLCTISPARTGEESDEIEAAAPPGPNGSGVLWRQRMKRALIIALSLLLGAAAGVGSAMVVLDNGQLLGQTNNDYWFGNRNAGSAAADPYTRGIVAKIGLLALNRSETIYFHRYKDENGEALREGCAYELSGGDLPTRW